jgi:hypothetical protein
MSVDRVNSVDGERTIAAPIARLGEVVELAE